MKRFNCIDYLKSGNTRQKALFTILKEHEIMDLLAEYDPVVVGTIPIEIDLKNSDVDICCLWKNKEQFIQSTRLSFSKNKDFKLIEKCVNGTETVIISFKIDPFPFEIFGQNRPSHEQEAYRHMIAEYNILQKQGEAFRKNIIKLKENGMKTEPAFCKLLELKGDPFKELLLYKIN